MSCHSAFETRANVVFCHLKGVISGCEKRKPSTVQVPRQVLPRRCGGRVDPRHHSEAVLHAGERRHPQRRDLLSSGDCRASGFLFCTGQIWWFQQRNAQAWIPDLRSPPASTVRMGQCFEILGCGMMRERLSRAMSCHDLNLCRSWCR